MGMVYCRGCGKEIHDSATTCPHCGAVQRVPAAADAPTSGTGTGMSTGLLVAGYICALLLPVGGVVIGIIALTKKAVGHGIAMLGISLLMIIIYIAATVEAMSAVTG